LNAYYGTKSMTHTVNTAWTLFQPTCYMIQNVHG